MENCLQTFICRKLGKLFFSFDRNTICGVINMQIMQRNKMFAQFFISRVANEWSAAESDFSNSPTQRDFPVLIWGRHVFAQHKETLFQGNDKLNNIFYLKAFSSSPAAKAFRKNCFRSGKWEDESSSRSNKKQKRKFRISHPPTSFRNNNSEMRKHEMSRHPSHSNSHPPEIPRKFAEMEKKVSITKWGTPER